MIKHAEMKKGTAALLIIDMQEGSFTPKTPRFDAEGVVNRINQLAQIFRGAGLPVIFIQHDGTKMNEFIPNTREWELLNSLLTKPEDIYINKYANDAFYRSQLQSKLTELKVRTLFISGCATDFCIESTIQSALTKDFNIVIVEDGHTTGERPHSGAENIIKHYNWVWKNMIPTDGSIEVRSFNQIKEHFIGGKDKG